ncbi:DUF58 domain-containing protein [Candidatus Woesearchaeota archaeon]|nr:DUF58 domain-containing protein [Candidatus Woesearchaeota archaeon]
MPVKSLNIDLLPVLRKIPFVKKGLLTSTTVGAYKSVFKGRGLEFAGYRPYSTTDDASLIDWKATARTGDVLVREYIEERNLNIIFLFDVSDSMLFGSTDKLKAEYAAELVASLSYTMLEAGDNTGMVLFTDRITAKLYPNRGRQQYYAISKILTNPGFYGGRLDITQAAKYVLTTLKENSVVILVSDFINFNDTWEKYLKFMSAKFEIIGIMIKDPRDLTLPKDVGQVVIQDPYSDKQLLIEPELIKKTYEALVKKQIDEVKEKFLILNEDIFMIETNESFIKPLMTFFRKRAYKK